MLPQDAAGLGGKIGIVLGASWKRGAGREQGERGDSRRHGVAPQGIRFLSAASIRGSASINAKPVGSEQKFCSNFSR
jgi:hypothetical protein